MNTQELIRKGLENKRTCETRACCFGVVGSCTTKVSSQGWFSTFRRGACLNTTHKRKMFGKVEEGVTTLY